MNKLRPNEQRAHYAVNVIRIVLLMEIALLISGCLQYNLLQTAANGGEISPEQANANDTRAQFLGILYTIAYITSAITFILWFRRAYFNLHMKVKHLNYSEGWAAGSWFVPFINLYRPYQIMKELYEKSKRLLLKEGVSFDVTFSTDTLTWWWGLWIINNLIAKIEFRYSSRAESIDELTNSSLIGMLSNAFGIALALITIKVIKDYSAMELKLAEIKNDNEEVKLLSEFGQQQEI